MLTLELLERQEKEYKEMAAIASKKLEEEAAIARAAKLDENRPKFLKSLEEAFPGFAEQAEIECVYDEHRKSVFGVRADFVLPSDKGEIPFFLTFRHDYDLGRKVWHVQAIAPDSWFDEDGDFIGGGGYSLSAEDIGEDELLATIHGVALSWLKYQQRVEAALNKPEPTIDEQMVKWEADFAKECDRLSRMSVYPVVLPDDATVEDCGLFYHEWLIGQAMASGLSRGDAIREATETIKALALTKLPRKPQKSITDIGA